jgi:hypothetical protein
MCPLGGLQDRKLRHVVREPEARGRDRKLSFDLGALSKVKECSLLGSLAFASVTLEESPDTQFVRMKRIPVLAFQPRFL